MMDKPKSLIKKSLQKEKQIVVHPLPLRKPSVTHSNASGLYTLPLLQPSFKFLAINHPNSTNSSRGAFSRKEETKSLEPSSSEVRNTTYNYKLQEIPKSYKVREEGFKCSALCMPLPGFGKTKPVKARKEETQMHAVNPVLSLSKPSSLEKFERSCLVSQARMHENEGDNSISSYFDLPSELFKFSSHNA
ncbi:hypothetical protein DEO72_LG2g5197 [Vigna unguiculata]|uniref:Uncharacterized protein n=1 Tax=Vigna unguiculata TaxID=3917 RepID=A0A4D6L8J5_VIGUN|nr:hypothetical protein DEO72_LG2g5197 [Vigna unguiculata]